MATILGKHSLLRISFTRILRKIYILTLLFKCFKCLLGGAWVPDVDGATLGGTWMPDVEGKILGVAWVPDVDGASLVGTWLPVGEDVDNCFSKEAIKSTTNFVELCSDELDVEAKIRGDGEEPNKQT